MDEMQEKGDQLVSKFTPRTPVLRVSQFLKDYPGALNHKFKFGYTGTLLHFACWACNKEIIQFLLSQNEIDLNIKLESNFSPQHHNKTAFEIAKHCGKIDIINFFKNRNIGSPQPLTQKPQSQIVQPPSPIDSTYIKEIELLKNQLNEKQKDIEILKKEKEEFEKLKLKYEEDFQSHKNEFAQLKLQKDQLQKQLSITEDQLEQQFSQKEAELNQKEKSNTASFEKNESLNWSLEIEKEGEFHHMTAKASNLEELKDAIKEELDVDQPLKFEYKRGEKYFNLNSLSNLISNTTFSIKVNSSAVVAKKTSNPIQLFSKAYSTHLNVHDAIGGAMNDIWNDMNLKNKIETQVKEHYEKIKSNIKDLTSDEAMSIIYYTTDARIFGGKIEDSIFTNLSESLSSTNLRQLEKWKPYLFILLNALQKLPNQQTKVYRGFDKPLTMLSDNYVVGSIVTWPTLTSTRKSDSQLKVFASNNTFGTWVILQVKEGKDIKLFSVFGEEEIMLLPNTTFKVTEVLGSQFKELISLPQNMDVLSLEQVLPSPPIFID